MRGSRGDVRVAIEGQPGARVVVAGRILYIIRIPG
jgi:hypothetical protein